MVAALVKDDLVAVAARQEELEDALAQAPKEPRPLIYPAMARRYRAQVGNLRDALGDKARQGDAAELIRGLVEKAVLTPEEGKDDLAIDLYGDLAGILQIAANRPTAEDHPMPNNGAIKNRRGRTAVNDNGLPGRSVKLVAGEGFEPPTFGL